MLLQCCALICTRVINTDVPLTLDVCAGPGIAEGDENCKKFLEKTMPDAFQKVTSKSITIHSRT